MLKKNIKIWRWHLKYPPLLNSDIFQGFAPGLKRLEERQQTARLNICWLFIDGRIYKWSRSTMGPDGISVKILRECWDEIGDKFGWWIVKRIQNALSVEGVCNKSNLKSY